MGFDSGLPIAFRDDEMRFEYGRGVFGCEPEHRRLDAIRASLRDQGCDGPDPVYSIAMDVGREEDRPELERRMLLFGVVVFKCHLDIGFTGSSILVTMCDVSIVAKAPSRTPPQLPSPGKNYRHAKAHSFYQACEQSHAIVAKLDEEYIERREDVLKEFQPIIPAPLADFLPPLLFVS